MNSASSERRFACYRVLACSMGVAICLLGAMACLGWYFKLESLLSISAGWIRMRPNTALGLCIFGLALATISFGSGSIFFNWIKKTAALFLVALGSLTLVQYLTGWDLGLETLLFRKTIFLLEGDHPGGMAPSTAFCFILSGLAFWVAIQPSTLKGRLAILQALAAALIGIGTFSVIGYLTDSVAGYRGWNYTGMAIHTAVAFGLAGAGLFFLALGEGRVGWYLDRRTTIGFATGIFLMILAVNMAHHFTVKMKQMATSVAHRQSVLREIQQLGAELSDMESSQRGFIITGNEALLEKRPENWGRAQRKFDLLGKEIMDNPVQRENLVELGRFMQQKKEKDEQIIAEREAHGFTAASKLVSIGTGQDLWQVIRLQFGKMRNEEYRLIDKDQSEVEAASTLTFLLLPLGAFLSLTLISGGIFFLNAGMEERFRAEERLKVSLLEGQRTEEIVREREKQLSSITANLPGLVAQLDRDLHYLFANKTYEKWLGIPLHKILGRSIREVIGEEAFQRAEPMARLALSGERADFENQVTTRKGEKISMMVSFLPDLGADGEVKGLFVVAMDITRLKKAEDEIRQLNTDLEERVVDRTSELETANRELEAFSYSVSHDLRAPLRSVDGFSQAVLEDYGDVLPEEGKRYLQLVRGGAQKMGILIDDLLTFSRLSRLPLSRDEVNMNRLVSESLAELDAEKQKKTRGIEIDPATLPLCYGDATLLKQVWINLISNALKYTRKCESARIEIGFREEEGEKIYFIRDNGTGFDMRYADKLFGVFQRLHRAEDYEGTGVGLAIVQRVVHRHGGKIWADSKPGEGAAFYFTLEGHTI